MRLAIWGIGDHAKKNLIPAAIEAKDIEFIGIYSRNKKTVTETSLKYNCKSWVSQEEMLADTCLDAIFLSTPPALHFRQGNMILNSGKHFICEKPITTNFRETELLLKRAKERNLVILEAYMFLYHPHFLKIKEIIKNEINSLKEIDVVFELPELSSPGFRFSSNLGASCLYDVGSYTVLTILELFGDHSVELLDSDIRSYAKSKVDYSGKASLIINNKIICNIRWSYNSKYVNKISIKCSNKETISHKIFSKDQDYEPLILTKYNNGDISEEKVEATNHFVSMLEFFEESTHSKIIAEQESNRIFRLASFLSKIKG